MSETALNERFIIQRENKKLNGRVFTSYLNEQFNGNEYSPIKIKIPDENIAQCLFSFTIFRK